MVFITTMCGRVTPPTLPKAVDVWPSSCLPYRGPRLPGESGEVPFWIQLLRPEWCWPTPLGGDAPAVGVIKVAIKPTARHANGSSAPSWARVLVEASKSGSG